MIGCDVLIDLFFALLGSMCEFDRGNLSENCGDC